ncbi:prefoldin subunit alpha [archaeon]|nr:prefoldin subunit alpha [archaeon]
MDQSKMLQLEMLKEQGQQLSQQKSQISMQLQEIEYSKNTIADLKNAKKDTELMIPIGTGMYVKGKITNLSDIITTIGGSVAVGKSLSEVDAIIKERESQMLDLEKQINIELEKLDAEGRALVSELQKDESKTAGSAACGSNCGHKH